MILQRWPDSYKLLIESFPISSRLVIEVEGKGMEVEGLKRIVGDLGINYNIGKAEWEIVAKHLGGTKSLSIWFEGLHLNYFMLLSLCFSPINSDMWNVRK